MAAIEVAQTFVNTTGRAIEATYIFPLPDRAAVHRFRMEVAGRVIEGVVEERGARARAVRRGDRRGPPRRDHRGGSRRGVHAARRQPDAGRERDGAAVADRPAAGRRRRGHVPLPARRRAALHARAAALGGERAGRGRRQPSTPTLVPDASRISPPVLLPGCPNPVRLGLRVALEDHAAVRDVASSLHAVTTSRDDAAGRSRCGPASGSIATSSCAGASTAAALRSSLVCADDADGEAGTFLLTLVPPSTTTRRRRSRATWCS